MNQIRPFQHTESFEYLADGNQILTNAIDHRNEAIRLSEIILKSLDKLNSLHETYCSINGTKFLELNYEFSQSRFFGNENIKMMDRIKKDIDSRFWHDIVNNSGITSVMHSRMKSEFKASIDKDTPEFNHENVFGTLSHYTENRMKVYIDGVINLFESLDLGYKTNDGIKFREKIVFKGLFGSFGFCSYGKSSEQIADLERIFMVLEGKDPSRIPHSDWATRAIERAGRDGGENEFNYFKVRAFKNGNLHLWITREDLIEKLNGILSDVYGKTLGTRNSVRN